ncbi:MAG: vWA domain-containing protein [Candidatus Muiribacteriota bacterium]
MKIFAEPFNLTLIFAIPFLIILFTLIYFRKKSFIHKYFSNANFQRLTGFDYKKNLILRAVFLSLTLFFLTLSLARPQWGREVVETKRHGMDIMVAVDLSNSMYVEDMSPSRYFWAKEAVNEILNGLVNDRISLVIFGGSPLEMVPFSLDYGAVEVALDSIEPNYFPLQGTNYADLLKTSREIFERSHAASKVMIIISDGEDHSNIDESILEIDDVVVYTIGVGTTSGEIVPVFDDKGTRTGVKKIGDEIVMSRLEENTLRAIAHANEGKYIRLSHSMKEIDELIHNLKQFHREELESDKREHKIERFPYFLVFAFIFLLIDTILINGWGQVYTIHKNKI